MTSVSLYYDFIDRRGTEYIHSHKMKTGLCEGNLSESLEKKLDYECPAINNHLRSRPLRLNINRLIFCANPYHKDTRDKIIIPKTLTKTSNEWVLRIIYECSGLMRGSTLVWNLSFIRGGEDNIDNINKLMRKYLWNYLNADEQENLQDTYIHYLTKLWTIFLYNEHAGRNKEYHDEINQSLKKAMLREIKGLPANINYILGHIAANGTNPDNLIKIRKNAIKHMSNFIRNLDDKEYNWCKEYNGMPSETVEKMHFQLLQFVVQKTSAAAAAAPIDWIPYFAWCKIEPKDLPKEIPYIMKRELDFNYANFDFDDNANNRIILLYSIIDDKNLIKKRIKNTYRFIPKRQKLF